MRYRAVGAKLSEGFDKILTLDVGAAAWASGLGATDFPAALFGASVVELQQFHDDSLMLPTILGCSRLDFTTLSMNHIKSIYL